MTTSRTSQRKGNARVFSFSIEGKVLDEEQCAVEFNSEKEGTHHLTVVVRYLLLRMVS